MLRTISKEDLFNAFLHHSPAPAWISEDRRILFMNDAGVRLLGGVSSSQFEGEDFYRFVSPRCHSSVEEQMAQVGAAVPVEQEFVRLDGTVVPVVFTVSCFSFEGRSASQVQFLDLTNIKAAERSAAQTRAEMDLIIDKLPALVSYIDTKGRFVQANAAYARWMGVEPAQLFGREVGEVLSERVGKEYWRHLRPFLERALAGESCTARTAGTYPGGVREVEVHYSPDRDPYGQVRGVAVLVLDITEQEKVKAELGWRATLLEEAMEPIFAWKLPGEITYWNRAAEETYGYTRAEAIGKTSHILLRTRANIPMTEMEAYLQINGTWEGELLHTTKSGSEIVMEGRLRRIDIGGVPLVIECTRDVTQRKRAETGLRELTSTLERRIAERTKELSQANEELEAYAYSISHDLRAPLRTAQGFSDALLEDYADMLDDAGKMYASRIRAAAQRMDELIKDLLEYSRIGRADLFLERVELRSVVADVLQQQQAFIQEKRAVVTISPDLPAVIGHFSTLVQILGNLISNAIKFTSDGRVPVIAIVAKRCGRSVRVEVHDQGIGIQIQHQDRVFRVFERLHGAETYPGTGIGLAIVKKGVERLGGSLGLSSEQGKGSCFWFEIPAGSMV